ncbi:MAG: hypothetical protein Q7T07_07905 [Burkholderiaceae bacterium]|nr:hypothetical protein [Burkholderiaceae bacterium]
MDHIENLYEWFHEQPDRIVNIGSSFLSIGFVLLIAGLWGRVASTAAEALNHLDKQPAEVTLSNLFPNMPTWWIPESVLGCLFVLLLLVYGGILLFHGKRYKRIMSL